MKTSTRTKLSIFILAATALCSYATTNYWDNNGSAAGFGTAGGVWGSEGKWSSDVTGVSTPATTNTTAADSLFFGTATDGLAAGTITVDSTNQSFKTMTFGEASGHITLSGGTLNLASPASTVIINNNASNTINTVLDGTGGVRVYKNTEPLNYASLLAEPNLITASALSFTEQNTYSGNTTISNVVLRVGEGGQLDSGTYAGDISNSGILLYNSASNQILSGNISGLGALVMQSPCKTHPSSLTYDKFLTETPTVIFPNAELADCTGAGGIVGGSAVGIAGNRLIQGEACFFTNNGATATWQLQIIDDQYIKCVKIQLEQAGKDITGKVLYAKYKTSSTIGFDFDTGGNVRSVATSITTPNYGAAETTINTKQHSTLTLSGIASYSAGTVINAGILEVTSTADSLPSSGGIIVNSGGELILNIPDMPVLNDKGVGNGNPITVNRGGILNLTNRFNAGYSRSITINGGTLAHTYTENSDGANYINNLTLQNGAQVIGYKLRVGYISPALITVSGTNTCSIPAGINMVKHGTDPLTFDVADVTGDSNSDLTIPGVIQDYGTTYVNMPIIKTGAGTLSLSGLNTHKGVITIDEGTLALDGNNTLNADNSIVLSGGALAMGAYANSVGTLTLDGTSEIIAGTGELVFADSSAIAWSGTLSVSGALNDNSIRFGNSDTALTHAQLRSIVLNGRGAMLTDDGYLVASPIGTAIIVR